MTQESPPRPNLKEITPEKAINFLRACAAWFRSEAAEATEDMAHWARVYNGENCDKAANLIDSLLSERDEARNNALEEAAKVADDFSSIEHRKATKLFHRQGEGHHRHASDVADDIATNIRAMRGNAE